MKCIAFFDFDGTITKKDSLIEFIKYARGKRNFYLGLLKLSVVLLIYQLKFIPNNRAKEIFILHFFKGWNEKDFQNLANRYSNEEIDKIVRPKALDKIKWHLKKSHEVVIVSATMESFLKTWCHKNNLQLLATKLAFDNNCLTGRLANKNCYGIEKVNRILEVYDLENYKTIYAYGNSKGDKEMLNLAHIKHYKPF